MGRREGAGHAFPETPDNDNGMPVEEWVFEHQLSDVVGRSMDEIRSLRLMGSFPKPIGPACLPVWKRDELRVWAWRSKFTAEFKEAVRAVLECE